MPRSVASVRFDVIVIINISSRVVILASLLSVIVLKSDVISSLIFGQSPAGCRVVSISARMFSSVVLISHTFCASVVVSPINDGKKSVALLITLVTHARVLASTEVTVFVGISVVPIISASVVATVIGSISVFVSPSVSISVFISPAVISVIATVVVSISNIVSVVIMF